jgi:microsomal dipeptidase-like Zn-dependent dipeptidase
MNKKVLRGWIIFAAIMFGIKIGLNYLALLVQAEMNPTPPESSQNISSGAQEFHKTLIIADLHSDALLWDHDLTVKNSIGHVDIPRLAEGNVALQVFGVVTQVPQPENEVFGDGPDRITDLAMVELWPPRTWFDLTQRALYQARKLQNVEQRMDGQFSIIRSGSELADFLARREVNPELVAGILSLEGAHALEGNVGNIDILYNAGFRIVGLTHLSDNEIGGSSMGTGREGITDYGREVVRRLEARGMIIDLAHASPALTEDVLAATTQPVMVTHSGVKGICPNSRNLSDNEIKQIAERGGVIGIGFGPLFNCAPDLRSIVRSIQYVTDLVGVEHVALGSDYDGVIQAPFDPSDMALITQELMDTGFTHREIRKIMGENVLRFLQSNLP